MVRDERTRVSGKLGAADGQKKMRLVTSCPACNAAFYVSVGQLKAHQGNVRCGQCNDVFNALDRLAKVDDATSTEQPSPDFSEPEKLPDASTAMVAAENTPANSITGFNPPETATTTHNINPILADESAFKLSDLSVSDIDSITRSPLMEDSARNKAGIKRRKKPVLLKLLQALLAALLILLMLAQTVYFLRTDIAARWPETRAQLEQACLLVNCQVELPKNADLIAIDDSDLQEDADRRGLIHLYLSIINHAEYSQAYPLLELTLTDTYDKPLMRRTFKPEEYLSTGSDQKPGIAAKQAVRIKLSFTTDNHAIAGYRLFLTY
jgi:predicted Zn finger-like uncharacterized protein